MAAITKRLLHLRPTFHSHARPYPYTQHHFSSSSSSSDRDDAPQSESQSSISSSLNSVRDSLRNRPPQSDRQPPRSPFSYSSGARHQTPPQSRAGQKDEIHSRLSEFRSRSAPPPPTPPDSGGRFISLQELYEKNYASEGGSSPAPSGFAAGGTRSFDSIRESLTKLEYTGAMNSGSNPSDSWSLSRFTENLKNKAGSNANIAGGSGGMIPPFLNKDAMGKGGGIGLRNMEFGKMHDRSSLGDKLKTMRPEKRKGKWFSLQELSDRLAKVRDADFKECEKRSEGLQYQAISASLIKIKTENDQHKHAKSLMPIKILGSMGLPMDECTGPPKDHLVEKYFHPDNMSSAEKMKLELQKVRDEFKMSESDCGSARVQVAQLTTKIKHLSTALHKKDKHSRKGLNEMVQRRKKLLKYLRRTDWDSYSLVLSKLGLRDNHDIKA